MAVKFYSQFQAAENSSFIVSFAYTDEDGNIVKPQSLSYSLVDIHSTIINNREDVVLDRSATDIVLNSSDLSFLSTESEEKEVARVLTIGATVKLDGGILVPLISEFRFNIVKIT